MTDDDDAPQAELPIAWPAAVAVEKPPPPPWRGPGRPFKPGQSGNPRGPRKGLDKLVRELVGPNIAEIVRMQVVIATGKLPAELPEVQLRASDITRAAEWLTDRGWGKATQVVDISAELSLGQREAYGALTDEQLEALAALDGATPRELAEGDEAGEGVEDRPDDPPGDDPELPTTSVTVSVVDPDPEAR